VASTAVPGLSSRPLCCSRALTTRSTPGAKLCFSGKCRKGRIVVCRAYLDVVSGDV